MKTTHALLSILSTGAVLMGCAGPTGGVAGPTLDGMPGAPLATADQLHPFILASAAGMFAVDQAASVTTNLSDTACPVREQNGTTMVLRGGCTDSHGNQYTGTETIVQENSSSAASKSTTFDHFVSNGPTTCNGVMTTWRRELNGSVSWSASGTGTLTQAFHLDLVVIDAYETQTADCVSRTTAFHYDGTATSVPGEAVTYNGSGVMGDSRYGSVHTSTHDEVLDTRRCPASSSGLGSSVNEPWSGTTTLTAGGHTAVITYDGATSCDAAGTAPWTYDGNPMGELTDVRCSVRLARGSGGNAALLAGVALAFAVAIRRRRRPAK